MGLTCEWPPSSDVIVHELVCCVKKRNEDQPNAICQMMMNICRVWHNDPGSKHDVRCWIVSIWEESENGSKLKEYNTRCYWLEPDENSCLLSSVCQCLYSVRVERSPLFPWTIDERAALFQEVYLRYAFIISLIWILYRSVSNHGDVYRPLRQKRDIDWNELCCPIVFFSPSREDHVAYSLITAERY